MPAQLANERVDVVLLLGALPRFACGVQDGTYPNAAAAKAALEAYAADDAEQMKSIRPLRRVLRRTLFEELIESGDGTLLRGDLCVAFRVVIECSELAVARPAIAAELCADTQNSTVVEVARSITAGVDGPDLSDRSETAIALRASVRVVDCAGVSGNFSLLRGDTTLAGAFTCTHPEPSAETPSPIDVAPTPRDPVPRAINYERRGYTCVCGAAPCVTCPVDGGFLGRDPCTALLAPPETP